MATGTDHPSMAASDLLPAERPIVLFDGVCNLCNGLVQFVLEHDADASVQFAPLQSMPGQVLLDHYDMQTDDFDTFVLIDGTDIYTRSDAAIRLLANLDGAWSLLSNLKYIPSPLRNLGYRLVARTRYRIFGKKDRCVRPERDVGDVFVQGADVIPGESDS